MHNMKQLREYHHRKNKFKPIIFWVKVALAKIPSNFTCWRISRRKDEQRNRDITFEVLHRSMICGHRTEDILHYEHPSYELENSHLLSQKSLEANIRNGIKRRINNQRHRVENELRLMQILVSE